MNAIRMQAVLEPSPEMPTRTEPVARAPRASREALPPPRALTPEEQAYAEALELADQKVKFARHAVLWGATVFFFLCVAGLEPALVIGLSWGIFVARQGFSTLVAPKLRRRWIEEEVSYRVKSTVVGERRALEGKHARSLEELSASIAHEIRNPITAAKSLVQQMGEDPSSPENVEYAKVALEELDRVERSISHLLRFAREEDLQLAEMRIADVVDSAVETFRDRLARLQVDVKRDLHTERTMQGDPEKLRRVVINLIGNALDALEEAKTPSPSIEILAGENLAGTEVWLRVKDNGPGIEPGKLAKIWSPFYTSKSSGTGLGLAISKKLVEAHGGTIDATSELGRGTEMLVVVPRVQPEKAK
ncbi:HAMP domain-containing histidine kinase [Myxococcota bacterium]|nr:HAMP domain-containing histidine kinase [Myxococcota bacterium]